MPPQENDEFSFRLEMLKKELDFIDNSIRKIDDIANTVKNWAILAWTGAIATILGKPELYKYVLFSALPPLMFMMVDAHWRRIQRRLVYRQRLISDFLNSTELDEAFQSRKLNFQLFDPIARKSSNDIDFKQYISIKRILSFPTVSFIYIGLVVLSTTISLLLFIYPPDKQYTSTPSQISIETTPIPRPTHK